MAGGPGMDVVSLLSPLALDQSDQHQDAPAPLVELVRAAVGQNTALDWRVVLDSVWCQVWPGEPLLRRQGWKLHLSATRSSAPTVLERALGVLLEEHATFKFARTLGQLGRLNSTHYPRGGAGKFLTVYPADDQQFRRLAEQLDRATTGLPGPAILSDRPWRPGSLVHYRYGAFSGSMRLSNDGDYRPVLHGPDGTLVEDRRDAWFAPPPWAPPPPGEPPPVVPDGKGKGAPLQAPAPAPVLLGGRFVVREAIRHANRGGVFRASDRSSGAAVVVKQARPHVEAGAGGRDVRDALRHEARMLERLAPLGVAPRCVALFERDGHVFLAEELVEGVPLHRWIRSQAADGAGSGLGVRWPAAAALAAHLTDLLARVHGAGVVLRDLTPANLLVGADGRPMLVDLELAVPFGDEAAAAGTAGYAAPEQLRGAPVPAPAAATADLYSLGMVLFLLATGANPVFLEDRPGRRTAQERLRNWLALATGTEHGQTAACLTPAILGLTQESPAERWPLDRVRAFLATAATTPTQTQTGERLAAQAPATAGRSPFRGPGSGGAAARRLPAEEQERLLGDGLEHLLAAMTPEGPRLWPATCFGATTDPCNVQHGAAGVAAVLALACSCRGDGGERQGQRLHGALRVACDWIERRLPNEPRLLPGLYFGRAGTAWALHDAAVALGDAALAGRALALAARLPVTWPNPDVTHGAAGAGLALLHLWRASGEAALGRQLERCADGLLEAAVRDPAGAVLWPVPQAFESTFAGSAHYGFAHGAAGIGSFLLAAGLATGRGDCVAMAAAAGATLADAATRDGGAAWWGMGPHDPDKRLSYWCNGASGVGTFLLRLWQATGEARFRALAEQAAVAVLHDRWACSPANCHGLAGNGDFLLDLAWALGDERYLAWAEQLAAVLLAQCAWRGGRLVAPDESGSGLGTEYGVGLAGVLAFLLRLRHGGPRLWLVDAEAEAGTAPGGDLSAPPGTVLGAPGAPVGVPR